MRYLVTGGAGFIGSHITEKLLKEGHTVVVLDNFSSGKEENLSVALQNALQKQFPSSVSHTNQKETVSDSTFQLIKGDIRDKEACDRATKGADAIFHQAALRSVPKSMTAPHEYNDVNIDGTLTLLEAAKANKVKRFVFASSSSVYGDTNKFPEQEGDYPLLISPYALSKLAGEYYCRIFSEHFGIETVCLRYFNVFGPRQALDDEYAVVIPKFIHCILHDEQPPIFGTGKQSRDFTYIDNIVNANILAATIPGITHEVVNVANGKDNTVLGLVDSLNKILNKKIKPSFLPVRAGDVFRTLADISRLKEVLKYEQKVDFEEGLRRTVDWFEKIRT